MNDVNTQLILDAIKDLNTRFDGLETRFERFEVLVERRFDGLENRMDARFDILLKEINNIHSDIEVIRKHLGLRRLRLTERVAPRTRESE